MINGQATVPKQRDRVTISGQKYEVHPYNGEPHSRGEDPFGVITRIHLKKVAA